MAGLNPETYEAAMMDGASKLQQVIHITLPGIAHAIVILLIFRIGDLLDAGFEQILLLGANKLAHRMGHTGIW